MNDVTKESKEGTNVTAPRSAAGGLLSFDEFDSFFDDFLSRRWSLRPLWGGGANFPRLPESSFLKVDVLDYPDRIEVHAALPAGINKDAVELSINNQVLSIRASSKEEKEEKKEEGKYFRKEITRGEFQRTLSLPENVDENSATASFQDGILKIAIPKTEKSKRKTIEIA